MEEAKKVMARNSLRAKAAQAMLALGMMFSAFAPAWSQTAPKGEDVYKQVCIGCHLMGILGAPKINETAAWRERYKKSEETLVQNAINGIGKMPPRGGNPTVTPDGILAAIRFMAGEVSQSQSAMSTGQLPSPPKVEKNTKSTASIEGKGREIVDRVCKGCHELGVLNAPKIGARADWESRLKKGQTSLIDNAMRGIGNMPPKGGDAKLSREELVEAIRFMTTPAETPHAEAPALTQPKRPIVANRQSKKDVNRFNRLMTPPNERNPAPSQDGIHDPANPGTLALQSPKEAFASLPKGNSGNYVDWVRAFINGQIEPRYDRLDPDKKPVVMDLNIVREVKGSMPDVVYPHKPHLEWLDCSNCHPAIFEPRKGANAISMAEILLGKKCGVCHGKVAFPVSECRRCHSKKKPPVAVTQK